MDFRLSNEGASDLLHAKRLDACPRRVDVGAASFDALLGGGRVPLDAFESADVAAKIQALGVGSLVACYRNAIALALWKGPAPAVTVMVHKDDLARLRAVRARELGAARDLASE